MGRKLKVCFLVFFLAVLLRPVRGQNGSLDFNEVRTRLQAQDWPAAIELLVQLKETTPGDFRVWYWLGMSHHNLKQYEEALPFHIKASTYPAVAGPAMYNAACAYARHGEADKAFEWLEKARASAGVDMWKMESDADLASLKDDPRFRKLMPKSSDFDNAFVEPTRVIREWRGEASQDQYGWIARNIGDVDGDGINDVTTSAPTNGVGGPAAGKIYVYSSRTGTLLWQAQGEPGAQLGTGIEAAGDTNADGIPDVIAGAPGAAKAFVYSGLDGTVLLTLTGESSSDVFGRKVSDIGDFNGDSHDDVLVGAPGHSSAGNGAGRVYVFSGKDGSRLVTLDGERAGDGFGSSAGATVTGGSPVLVIGSPNAGEGNRGMVYVYSGREPERKFVIESDDQGVNLGAMFVSVVGDVNADGVPDIYGSDWQHAGKGNNTGQIYVVSGVDGTLLHKLSGEAAGDGFGIGVADAGDANGDGHDDLVIGAWQHGSAARSGGKVYLYSGRDGSLIRAWTCRILGDSFGFDATGMGDVNGDGRIDFLLTSAWSNVSGFRSGRMWIIGQ